MAAVTTLKELNEGKHPKGHKRSSKWASTRKHHLEKHGECALCGGTKKLEVHHIRPFHVHPELELEATNLITLCEDKGNGVYCHLFFGHLGSFKSVNENLLEDLEIWKNKLKNRPRNASELEK
jgi:hypothetical protein